MASSSSRLVVFDHNLKGHEGHHFDYSRSVSEAASLAGVVPELICHEDYPGAQLGSAPVVGRYRGSETTGIQRSARKILKGLPEPLRGVLLRTATSLPSVSGSFRPDSRFAAEFCSLVVASELGAGDHVFLHTVSKPEFLGLADSLSRGLPTRARLHFLLRYDGDADYRSGFATLGRQQNRIRFWTDTGQLAAQYRELGCPSIGVLPIPHGLSECAPEEQSPRHPLTLGFLGGARKDKGFQVLPDLIESLIAKNPQNDRIRFLIQATYATSRHEPLMAETRRRLRAFPKQQVELIELPPDTSAFHSFLSATDLLLLPYQAETYRRRSSGLLVQAMISGIPTVVPEDTWLAAEAPAGAHVAFGRDMPLALAVHRAVTDHAELLAAARLAKAEARMKHSVAALVRLILDLSR